MATEAKGIEIRVSEARFTLLKRLPFFGHLLTAVPIFVDEMMPTACVTNKGKYGELHVSPSFIGQLNRQELTAVLMHEVLHLALGAFPRRKHRDPVLWNIAHDYAINLMIADTKASNPSIGIEWPKAALPLLDERFKGMAAEEIYDLLLEESRGGGEPGKGDGEGGFGDATDCVEVVEPGSEEAVRQERALKNLLAEALEVQAIRKAGTLPGSILEAVDASLRVHVPWVAQLVHKVEGRLHGGGVSYAKLSRRSPALQIALPGRSRRRPRLAVVIDTSGSVSRDEIQNFLAAVRQILELNQAEMRLLQVDADIQDDRMVEDFDELVNAKGMFEVIGRGGTVFDAVPGQLALNDIPDLAVVFTDGEPAGWPSIHEWPCAVVVVTTRTLPPEGYEALVFEMDQDER